MTRLVLRSLLRVGGWGVAGVLLLGGLIGGLAIAGFVAAGRTESTYERFLSETEAFDVLFANGTVADNLNRQFALDDVARFPSVSEVGTLCLWAASGPPVHGHPVSVQTVTTFGVCGGGVGRQFNRFPVVEGREPRGEFEVAITPLLADSFELKVGDSFSAGLAGVDEIAAQTSSPPERFTVTGIVGMQSGFQPATGGLPPPMLVSATYVDRHPNSLQVFVVRLRHGMRSAEAFYRDLRSRTDAPVAPTDRTDFTGVQRSLRVQGIALRIGTGVLSVGGAVLLFLSLTRLGRRIAELNRSLLGLGASRAQRRRVAVSAGATAGVIVAAISAVVATSLSALGPVGTA